MKTLIFTSLLGLSLLWPASLSATANSTISKTEYSNKSPKKKTSKVKRSKTRSSKSYAQSKGCTYNGNSLNVGPRGGCYYYSGSSKVYVDRSYCSGCN
jgi:Pyruvate/2-oxoacid:ferredoxin oxidoreductase delta subunit